MTELHLTRLRDRRATVDGGEDCNAYFCSNVVLMRVVKRNPGLVQLRKGNFKLMVLSRNLQMLLINTIFIRNLLFSLY
ncbi:hypothetical protein L9F63_001042 [Diploptera punctata]|uniref:Uncharacterized protein n=1 Tax=Diploptera punctata TaxID=6984 RepID=A0AAD8AKH9_DIPPU|nr:hypothetical protein L9F63_001042 [Diploptera punctata]